MSKLLEMLEKAGQPSLTPIGFGAAVRREEVPPSIVLIGRTSAADLTKKGTAEANVDAILVSLGSLDDKALDAASDALGERLWGIETDAVGRDAVENLKEKGCDFVVFNPEKTEAALLTDEDLGKVMPVGPDVDEDTGRAISGLPIDCVMYSPHEGLLPLTVKKLMKVRVARGLVGKHFLMTAPPDLETPDLDAFRKAGVIGLVMDLTAPDALNRTKEAIAKLPRRKQGEDGRGEIIPRVPSALAPSSRDSDSPDEDDEEY